MMMIMKMMMMLMIMMMMRATATYVGDACKQVALHFQIAVRGVEQHGVLENIVEPNRQIAHLIRETTNERTASRRTSDVQLSPKRRMLCVKCVDKQTSGARVNSTERGQ